MDSRALNSDGGSGEMMEIAIGDEIRIAVIDVDGPVERIAGSISVIAELKPDDLDPRLVEKESVAELRQREDIGAGRRAAREPGIYIGAVAAETATLSVYIVRKCIEIGEVIEIAPVQVCVSV